MTADEARGHLLALVRSGRGAQALREIIDALPADVLGAIAERHTAADAAKTASVRRMHERLQARVRAASAAARGGEDV